MSSSMSTLASLYMLYNLLNPRLPTPLDYLPLVFRLLALSIAAPFLFITLLEVAGYLIVRTLGFTTRLPSPTSASASTATSQAASRTDSPVDHGTHAEGLQPVPVPASIPMPSTSDSSSTTHLGLPTPPQYSDAHRSSHPPQILLPASSPLAPHKTYFATPGEYDFKLSGTGLFSPPDSREGSPPRTPISIPAPGLPSDAARSTALGLTEGEVRSRSVGGGLNGLKALTPVEAR